MALWGPKTGGGRTVTPVNLLEVVKLLKPYIFVVNHFQIQPG